MKTAVLLVTAVLALGVSPAHAEESEPALEEILTERELDPVRSSDHVETLAAEIRDRRAGSYVLSRESVPVPEDAARELSRLLLAPGSYSDRVSACFTPAVAIRFYKGERAVDALVCFDCRVLVFQSANEAHSHSKLAFDPVQETLLELVRRVRPGDERLAFVRQKWSAHLRWMERMPASLRPLWKDDGDLFLGQDIVALHRALAQEIPESTARIRALLTWYGSGRGPWSDFPSYEETAERLLIQYSTGELIAACSGALSKEQSEGAARLFSDDDFQSRRPQDLRLLPDDLRKRLLEHVLASGDEDRKARARSAFAAH